MYTLPECLFDPSHKKEASIQQTADGALYYQCFHNSCSGRKWEDAKRKISGDQPLTPFREGYDPNWQPPADKKRARPKASRPAASSPPPPAGDHEGGESPPQDYFYVAESGSVKVNTSKLADYLGKQFEPLVSEGRDFGGMFYRYDSTMGLWKQIPLAEISKLACDALGDHARTNRINDSLFLLESKKYKSPDELTPDPMWLNLRNCMLNVATMETKAHGPEFNSRVQLPIDYDQSAKCARWFDALAGIFGDDLSKVDVLQEFFGYCLYPKIIFPCAMFNIGKGGNGKGTVQHVLETMLGDQNVCHISLQRMEERWGPIELKDKLLNACGETSEKPLEVTRFKEICAADKVQAEVKYKADVIYRPIAKHLVSMNAFPGIKDKTDAFFRRIIVMEYKQQFEGANDNTELKDQLVEELNGIFIWALEGLKRVLEHKAIKLPECVQQAKRRMRAWVNPVLNFVDEVCEQGAECRCWPPDLYGTYLKWCEHGKNQPKGKQKFYEDILTNFGVRKLRDRDATREHFQGISVDEERVKNVIPPEQMNFKSRKQKGDD
jgi:P4 family phage/plasmid primase-like protien